MDAHIRLLIALACSVAAATIFLPGVPAAKTECNGVFSGTTLSGGVVVNPGDFCTLDHVTISGGLTVNGGSLAIDNSTISGGWTITGPTFPANFCGNNVAGGLRVTGTTLGGTFAFGEINQNCAGGTITGGVWIANNPGVFAEIDNYTISGGLTIIGNDGGAELEGSTVSGAATCQAGTFNDEGGPNTFRGRNNGCPA